MSGNGMFNAVCVKACPTDKTSSATKGSCVLASTKAAGV
jgi:hypothetical protein